MITQVDELMTECKQFFKNMWIIGKDDQIFIKPSGPSPYLQVITFENRIFKLEKLLKAGKTEYVPFNGNLKLEDSQWLTILEHMIKAKNMQLQNSKKTEVTIDETETSSTSTTPVSLHRIYLSLKNHNYKTVEYFDNKMNEKISTLASHDKLETSKSTIFEVGDERLEIFKPKEIPEDYQPKNAVKNAGVIDFIKKHGHQNLVIVTLTYNDNTERLNNNLYLLKEEPVVIPLPVAIPAQVEISKSGENNTMNIISPDALPIPNYLISTNTGSHLTWDLVHIMAEFQNGMTFNSFIRKYFESGIHNNGNVTFELKSADGLMIIKRLMNHSGNETVEIYYTESSSKKETEMVKYFWYKIEETTVIVDIDKAQIEVE